MDARDIGSTLTGFVIDNSSGFKMDDSAIDMVAIRMSSAASYVTVSLVAVLWINSFWRRLWFLFTDNVLTHATIGQKQKQ